LLKPPQDEDVEESEVDEEMQRPASTSMGSESTETISEGEQAQQSTSFMFHIPSYTFGQDSSLLSPTDGFNKESGIFPI